MSRTLAEIRMWGELRPVLIWMHGGAFYHGGLDMPESHDVAMGVAGRAHAVVVSVDYRLCDAPPAARTVPVRPNPGGVTGVHWPLPLDDCIAAITWVFAQATQLGIDSQRVSVGGASAGGCLAASAACQAARSGLALQAAILLYPLLHPELPDSNSHEARANDLTPRRLRILPEQVVQMNENYAGMSVTSISGEQFVGALSSPELAAWAREGAAPVMYIETAEYDELRPSGRCFAQQSEQAGFPTRYRIRKGVPHGYLNLVGFDAAHESLDAIAGLLQGGSIS